MNPIKVPSYIQNIDPYQGGLPIKEVARKLNLSENNIVKLASNENPLGMSPLAKKAIEESLGEVKRYPDGNGFYLKDVISQKHNLDPAQIILGNGSNDILELVARTFLSLDDEAIYSEHAFAVYPLVVKSVGAQIKGKNGRWSHLPASCVAQSASSCRNSRSRSGQKKSSPG